MKYLEGGRAFWVKEAVIMNNTSKVLHHLVLRTRIRVFA